jgi:iron-sulfur cluster repair protein YtfE (RIC family)
MDVVKLLKEDHDRVRELFRRYKGGGGLTGLVKRVTGAVEAREQRDALKKVCDEIDVHARLEEEIFYPALRATGDEELLKQVEEGVREHAQAKRQVAELRPRFAEAAALSREVGELESCIDHHATEEENEMFPRVEQVMPDAQRAALAS